MQVKISKTTFERHANKMTKASCGVSMPAKGTRVLLSGRIKIKSRTYGPAVMVEGTVGAKGALDVKDVQLRDDQGGLGAATEKRLTETIRRIWLSATNAEAWNGFNGKPGHSSGSRLPLKGSVLCGSIDLTFEGVGEVPTTFTKTKAPAKTKALATGFGEVEHEARIQACAENLVAKFGWGIEKAREFTLKHL